MFGLAIDLTELIKIATIKFIWNTVKQYNVDEVTTNGCKCYNGMNDSNNETDSSFIEKSLTTWNLKTMNVKCEI